MPLKLYVLIIFLPKALKVAAGQIAPSLAYLFNQSFQQGVFPTFWKTAKVTALPKGKDNTLCDNFRPISVLPCLSKVMEKFANNQLQAFVLKHNLNKQRTVCLPK